MDKIEVRKPTPSELEELNVKNWPIWTKEESVFDWYYDSTEVCYFIEGEVDIVLDNQKEIHIEKGDLVTFPKGLSCTWKIKKKVRKHYSFKD